MAQQSRSAFESTPEEDAEARRAALRRAQSHRGPRAAFAVTVGKIVRGLSRLRGGGSSLPGLVVDRLDPAFLTRTLTQLPLGVMLVSGTNGKTTTTRMISQALGKLGLRVFTNPTGANFVRGVISSLLPKVTLSGRLSADIAVLELDEAYSVRFVQRIAPRYSVLLNVMRDQLDRFGEIDTTRRLLSHDAAATSGTVILNREDRLIRSLASCVKAPAKISWFGVQGDQLRALLPDDAQLQKHTPSGLAPQDVRRIARNDANDAADTGATTGTTSHHDDPGHQDAPADALPDADVLLSSISTGSADYTVDGQTRPAFMRVTGAYNMFNAAAALAAIRAVLHDAGELANSPDARKRLSVPQITRLRRIAAQGTTEQLRALSAVTPAFGRGETLDVDGTPVELILVKNPDGFRLALRMPIEKDSRTMIAINDEYADSRDMSWLWDVDYSPLRRNGVAMVSGMRAWDMALRLGYAGIPIEGIDQGLSSALDAFLDDHPQAPKKIYCTYTAMLAIRHLLSSRTKVTNVGVGK